MKTNNKIQLTATEIVPGFLISKGAYGERSPFGRGFIYYVSTPNEMLELMRLKPSTSLPLIKKLSRIFSPEVDVQVTLVSVDDMSELLSPPKRKGINRKAKSERKTKFNPTIVG